MDAKPVAPPKPETIVQQVARIATDMLSKAPYTRTKENWTQQPIGAAAEYVIGGIRFF